MATLHVLRVFCAEDGSRGNPLGIFLDGAEVPPGRRQAVAADLNFSETVFVDDRRRGGLEIYTPAAPIPFAGHPLVGTGWLLTQEDGACGELNPPPGRVPVRQHNTWTCISAPGSWAPDFNLVKLSSIEEVEALRPEDFDEDVYAWAWSDAGAGIVRARSFVPTFGIPEDEATGSAALALCAKLETTIRVLQGRGSEISATPLDDGTIEICGRVVLDAVRPYT